MSKTIRFAIQRKGRLHEQSLQLLRDADIEFPSMKESLRVQAYNFPLELLLVRDDDIAEYIKDGVADAGIVGANVLAESEMEFSLQEKLGFGRCRLSVATPRGSKINTPEDLDGCRIATSHRNILSNYLKSKKINAEIYELSGSVEMAPSLGLSDVVCDLVSTGSTLISNGLEEKFSVFNSEATLISNNADSFLLSKLLFRLSSVKRAAHTKYILLNAANETIPTIVSLLPGVKSPTIVPLAKEGWSSIHSVVDANHFWEVIEQLKEAGAQGILIMPIEKMIL